MYESTRGNYSDKMGREAIALGMVPTGGLFVPKVRPTIHWEEYRNLPYKELANKILNIFLPDFPETILEKASSVYEKGVFDTDNPAPIVDINGTGILELWHGPTSAFKDMALQVLPHLLGESIKSQSAMEKVLILVATSGDTGKAALQGFKNVDGTEIIVFYPEGGVSIVQERQMTTTDGNNTRVVPVKGNFDECQSVVKEIFADQKLRETFEGNLIALSSANSINWGRLLPQIVYYIWAYIQAVESGKVAEGEPINVVVPTGNFGNILAAYYAKEMGLPIKELICASNQNNVLTDFFVQGTYDRNRPFHLTTSPSMDILISSNFERFLYEMSGKDSEKISRWFSELHHTGKFTVDPDTLSKAQKNVKAGWADEESVNRVIHRMFHEHSYVLDPHTAVAVKVYEDYVEKSGDKTYTVIASTASPFKFANTVLKGIDPSKVTDDEWNNLETLSQITGWEIPTGLQGLKGMPTNSLEPVSPGNIPNLVKKTYIG